MKRQLRKGGGIMDAVEREKFGFGSKLKKFVRKVIPNEIADVAVKAAPFVAPFNPALAAGMSGLGSFDQTGSVSDALKRGALTYGGGQAARFIGGAGFQALPGTQDFGGLGGFTQFSSPLGKDTGIGKLLNDRRQQAIGKRIAEQGQLNKEVANIGQVIDTGGLETGATTVSQKNIVSTDPSFLKGLKEGDPNQIVSSVFDAAKKAGKAIFYDKEGNLDKSAVLAAVSAAASYAEAKALAGEAGVDLSKEEYDEAKKEEKSIQYADYLKNFYGGKAEGGRIGFNDGTISFSKEEKNFLFRNLAGLGGSDRTITMPQLYGILKDPNNPNSIADAKALKAFLKIKGFKEGGRIGYKEGDIIIPKSKKDAFMTDKELEETMPGLAFGEVKNYENMKKEAIESFINDLKIQGFDDQYIMDQVMKQFGNKFDTPSIKLEERNNKVESDIFGIGDSKKISKVGNKIEDKIGGLGSIITDKDGSVILPIQILRKFGEDIFFGGQKNPKLPKKFYDKLDNEYIQEMEKIKKADGGRIGFMMGSEVPIRKNQGGVMELDYREDGGFVPVGIKEKADDVPAMLSKNEFVLTADAVRGVGNGNVEKGAEKLYNFMKQAEQVGKA